MMVLEFILRKPFIKGNLRRNSKGFSFSTNNSFALATGSRDGRKFAVSLVNRHPARRMKVAVNIKNAETTIRFMRINILSAETPLSENSVDNPGASRQSEQHFKVRGETFSVVIPACPVAVLN
jgi:hypothetical protein